jgi:hypothetical protein
MISKPVQIRLVTVALLVATTLSASATDVGWAWIDGPPQTYWGGGVTVLSKYIWRGFERSEDAVAQGSLHAGVEGLTGAVFGTWDTEFDEWTEAQYSVEYRVTNEAGAFGVGYIYYDFPEGGAILLPPDQGDPSSTQEVYVEMTAGEQTYGSLQVYYDFDEGDGTYAVFILGTDTSIGKVPVHLDASIGYNDKLFWSESAFSDVQVGIELPIRVTKNLMFIPMGRYSFALDEDLDDHGFGGASLTLNF